MMAGLVPPKSLGLTDERGDYKVDQVYWEILSKFLIFIINTSSHFVALLFDLILNILLDPGQPTGDTVFRYS